MNTIERVKNVLLVPKSEWQTISEESDTHVKILTTYLIPLALIPAVASFIGYGLIGYSVMGVHVSTFGFGIREAVVSFISTIAGVYLTAWIISFLADKFGSVKNFDNAFKLVAYSYTPMLIGGILLIFPKLAILVTIAGLYGLYLLYLGFVPVLKTPEDKKTSYFVVSLICVVICSFIVSAIFTAILLPSARVFI